MSVGKKFNRGKNSESASYGVRHANSRLLRSQSNMFERHMIAIIIIPILAILLTMICFWGQDLIWIQFIPNSKARLQMIAQIPFEYPSKIKTQRLREQRRNLVAPVFKIDSEIYTKLEEKIYRLDELLDSFTEQKQQTDAYLFELKTFVRGFNEKYMTNISWSDMDTLIRGIDECGRTGILIEGLTIVKEILEEGVFDQNLSNQQSEEYFLNIEVQGASRRAHYRSEEEASRFVKLRLFSVEASADVLQATYRLLKTGIKPNIAFDSTATNRKITKAVQMTPDAIEKVALNDVIIENGSMITAEDYECLLAYRNALDEAHISSLHVHSNFFERLLFSSLVLILVYLFFCTTRNALKSLQPKELLLAILLLLLNLLICRVLVWLFEWRMFAKVITFMQVEEGEEIVMTVLDPLYLLPYSMPLTLSCLLGTLLLRTYVGVLLGLVTSIFCNAMLSQSIEFLIVEFVVIFVAAYCVRYSYARAQVIRSGNASGVAFAMAAIILAVNSTVTREALFVQALIGFFNCLLVSMIVLTILPFFENIFKCCTNICLIELTDYRNPLLMKLQILAPGTYQHSLMVANLSEQAAISIHANPFLCRTLAMYHDVGKLVKPEYFTENQSKHKNPHDTQTPFMSALIIKSHVKEGVALAKAAGIPPRIIDGIMEHHGTTVIRYFYSKALKQQENPAEIEKSAFKYDGPRPRSRETLILSLADSLEAASRSLYNPTPQSIRTMVDGIIDGKIKESQFDDCSVNFHEVSELRQTFFVTLLNMLHSRVSYDEVKA